MKKRLVRFGWLAFSAACGINDLQVKNLPQPEDLPVEVVQPFVCEIGRVIDWVKDLNAVSLPEICGGQTKSKNYEITDQDKYWLRLIRDCALIDRLWLEDPGLRWEPVITSTSATALPAEFALRFALVKEESDCVTLTPLLKMKATFVGADLQAVEREPTEVAVEEQLQQAFSALNPADPNDFFSFCGVVEAGNSNPCGKLVMQSRFGLKTRRK